MRKLQFLFFFITVTASVNLWACDLDSRIDVFQKKAKESQYILDNKSLADVEVVKHHLTVMVEIDQEVRKLLAENFKNTKLIKIIQEIDHFHTNHLKDILVIHPWITISKFGKKADNQAWLLVQHADQDPSFQMQCLSVLERRVLLQETDKSNYAYLHDRVAVALGRKQRYGTQANLEGEHVNLLPYEGSLDEVNQRRQDLDLCSIEEYVNILKRVYKK